MTQVKNDDYIVFLGRNEAGEVYPKRITRKPSKLKPKEGEFAAYVVGGKDKAEAAWLVAQMYYSTMAIALSELWVMDEVQNAQEWSWDEPFHKDILEGVFQAKEEFAQHLNVEADSIALPEKQG